MITAVCQEPSPPKTFQVLYTVVDVLLSLSVESTSGYKTTTSWRQVHGTTRATQQPTVAKPKPQSTSKGNRTELQ